MADSRRRRAAPGDSRGRLNRTSSGARRISWPIHAGVERRQANLEADSSDSRSAGRAVLRPNGQLSAAPLAGVVRARRLSTRRLPANCGYRPVDRSLASVCRLTLEECGRPPAPGESRSLTGTTSPGSGRASGVSCTAGLDGPGADRGIHRFSSSPTCTAVGGPGAAVPRRPARPQPHPAAARTPVPDGTHERSCVARGRGVDRGRHGATAGG